ncbi:unnamed protein product, partial [Notodromas monacha]
PQVRGFNKIQDQDDEEEVEVEVEDEDQSEQSENEAPDSNAAEPVGSAERYQNVVKDHFRRPRLFQQPVMAQCHLSEGKSCFKDADCLCPHKYACLTGMCLRKNIIRLHFSGDGKTEPGLDQGPFCSPKRSSVPRLNRPYIDVSAFWGLSTREFPDAGLAAWDACGARSRISLAAALLSKTPRLRPAENSVVLLSGRFFRLLRIYLSPKRLRIISDGTASEARSSRDNSYADSSSDRTLL